MTNATAQHTNFADAKFSNNMTNASLRWANLTRTEVGAADFTGADLAECDLSDARFAEARRSTHHPSGEYESRTVYARLSQTQLDKAVCAPGHPPSIAEGTTDIETGLPLKWRGSNRHTCQDGAHLPCGNASCAGCEPCERCDEQRAAAATATATP